jgi:hypothetical protein
METQIIDLIARDRIEVPLSSMDQKLRRGRLTKARTLAEAIGLGGEFETERVYARVEDNERHRARGMKEAVTEFVTEYPAEGAVLKAKIAQKRVSRDRHLYFGTNPDKRLTRDDYVEAMESSGLTTHVAHMLYPVLMDVSRRLDSARGEERSIVVGKYD